MGDNSFAKKLLFIENKDINTLYSYIDISDSDDLISFMPTSKLKKALDEKPLEFEVLDNGRYLKPFSNANKKIFAILGYEPGVKREREEWDDDDDDMDGYNEDYIPSVGTVGVVLAEATGEQSGNTYCRFKYGNGREIVFNKLGLTTSSDSNYIWKMNRNAIKIGRFVKNILEGSVDMTSKDVEDFVNKYKAAYAMEKDEFKKFDIVSGSDISKWYKKDNYLSGGGPLNNSCMACVDPEYFDIYVENAKMIILYTKGGHIENGKYVSSKIRGRALLWSDVTMDDEPITFMDRVYTTLDSDVELFKSIAKTNGWWYKKHQSMEPFDVLTNGISENNNAVLAKKMSCVDFDRYPFMDTLCNINMDTKIATNSADDYNRRLRTTGGGYENNYDNE